MIIETIVVSTTSKIIKHIFHLREESHYNLRILHNLLFYVLIQCIIIQNQILFGAKNFVIYNRQKLKRAVLFLVCDNQFIANADFVKHLFKMTVLLMYFTRT